MIMSKSNNTKTNIAFELLLTIIVAGVLSAVISLVVGLLIGDARNSQEGAGLVNSISYSLFGLIVGYKLKDIVANRN